jgi:hypothetical protein
MSIISNRQEEMSIRKQEGMTFLCFFFFTVTEKEKEKRSGSLEKTRKRAKTQKREKKRQETGFCNFLMRENIRGQQE